MAKPKVQRQDAFKRPWIAPVDDTGRDGSVIPIPEINRDAAVPSQSQINDSHQHTIEAIKDLRRMLQVRPTRDELTALIKQTKLVTTKPLLIESETIQLPSKPLGDILHGMALVFMDLTGEDFNPDGSLKGDRSYLVEDHINVVPDQNTAVFSSAESYINGKYAVVSYLSIA